ncbi:MAG: DEAD/DEAH box helicase [Candidatus Dormibacteria bacterium]
MVFERLVKAFLSQDPLFQQRFSRIWLWQEWPGRGGERDTGIDLVAEERSGGLCAIQCKFYGQGEYIGREDIDPFLVASGRMPFTARLFVSTTERWSQNAERAVTNQRIPVQRIGVAELEGSPFDWSRFDPDHPDQLPRHTAKRPRAHQVAAVEDVVSGFGSSDRGKLIMACGTGKTFTALAIAERVVPAGGTVLFCVPSISLLSQTLRAWSADATRPLHCLAVCSDTQVTRDSEDIHVYDLALPATTDPQTLSDHMQVATAQAAGQENPLIVIFSTYQSLDRVAEAQGLGVPVFDLVVADEAHRTTGALAAEEGYSGFTMVHDGDRLRARRRLYMTATPRLYSDRAKSKARESEILLCSMDDEALYGPEFHYLGFGKAVEAGLLSDYRVVVLMVDEAYANEVAHEPLADPDLDLGLQDAARLVGCWRGLSKRGRTDEEFAYDPAAMRRAVAFSTSIAYSKRVKAGLPEVVAAIRGQGEEGVACEARHVDGTMGALVRDQALAWLREDPPEGTCRVLTNARCLSEGVDVPALDSVIFTNPRKSQIDVVQAVGRVMRRAEGKRYGYVIIPVPVPAGMDPEEVLDSNERYKVVWQVLQALRAHDDRFDAEVNKLDLQRRRSDRIQVVGVGSGGEWQADRMGYGQLDFAWQGLEDKVYARVVQKVGTRTYWEDWAGDVARIAQAHITRIKTAVGGGGPVALTFERYLASLRATLNPAVREEEAIEMLAQHLITMPVFEALFGDSEFTRRNPVSEAMSEVLLALHEEEAIAKERAELADFYRSVRTRAEKIDNLEGRQKVVKELYEVFFRKAFPLTADRLGIVYTPVEIVDFMLRSVGEILGQEFGTHLGADGIHVLDPFSGTGTFIARLLAMLDPDDLEPSYRSLVHANEIVLLAYYVAAVNIEQTYHALRGDGPYEPFTGIVLADTFQMGEGEGELMPEFLRPNSERAQHQQKLPITVVVANPPYSAGQQSENDDNQNLSYPRLDGRIRATYAASSTATTRRWLYDSYVRALRWASDRVGDRGIVAFVTNASFLRGQAADGIRACFEAEFSSVHVVDLRGDARTSGDRRAAEAGNVFGQGSRLPVAITFLVKNPDAKRRGIFYYGVDDYRSREQKLGLLTDASSTSGLTFGEVHPNPHHDWLDQRDSSWEAFLPLVTSEDKVGIFRINSNGLVTSRDSWVYNSSREQVEANVARLIDAYEDDRSRYLAAGRPARVEDVIDSDPRRISWSDDLKGALRHGRELALAQERIVPGIYRPFLRQWLYFDRSLNKRLFQLGRIFPSPETRNPCILVSGRASHDFAVLAGDLVPNFHTVDTCRAFPRYVYADHRRVHSPEAAVEPLFADISDHDPRQQLPRDNVTDQALDAFRATYPLEEIAADDVFAYVYAVLHHPGYRERFANNFSRELPRIPFLEGFYRYVEIGQQLLDLHIGYESVEPWPLAEELDRSDLDPRTAYRATRMEHPRLPDTRGRSRANADRSRLKVNDHLTLASIPADAWDYRLGSRPALQLVIERLRPTTDSASGIENDPNDLSDDPRYVVDLVKRVVRVAMESTRLVGELPEYRLAGDAS